MTSTSYGCCTCFDYGRFSIPLVICDEYLVMLSVVLLSVRSMVGCLKGLGGSTLIFFRFEIPFTSMSHLCFALICDISSNCYYSSWKRGFWSTYFINILC